MPGVLDRRSLLDLACTSSRLKLVMLQPPPQGFEDVDDTHIFSWQAGNDMICCAAYLGDSQCRGLNNYQYYDPIVLV